MIKLERPVCPNPSALAGGNYKDKLNKTALVQGSFGKCMYCESKFTHIDYGDIEHFRPKAVFPALEYDWGNLGISCTKCNRENKKDRFDENLINPYDTDPENHLIFSGGIIFPSDDSPAGGVTIDLINLNRVELVERRTDTIRRLYPLVARYRQEQNTDTKEALKEQILLEQKENMEFSKVVRDSLRQAGIS